MAWNDSCPASKIGVSPPPAPTDSSSSSSSPKSASSSLSSNVSGREKEISRRTEGERRVPLAPKPETLRVWRGDDMALAPVALGPPSPPPSRELRVNHFSTTASPSRLWVASSRGKSVSGMTRLPRRRSLANLRFFLAGWVCVDDNAADPLPCFSPTTAGSFPSSMSISPSSYSPAEVFRKVLLGDPLPSSSIVGGGSRIDLAQSSTTTTTFSIPLCSRSLVADLGGVTNTSSHRISSCHSIDPLSRGVKILCDEQRVREDGMESIP